MNCVTHPPRSLVQWSRSCLAPGTAHIYTWRINCGERGLSKASIGADGIAESRTDTGQLVRQLASRFGEKFAQVAESLPEGQWSDPVETPFGVHVLLVEERTPPQAPPLAEIRARVVAAYKTRERQERLATAMKELRARYEVVVECGQVPTMFRFSRCCRRHDAPTGACPNFWQ